MTVRSAARLHPCIERAASRIAALRAAPKQIAVRVTRHLLRAAVRPSRQPRPISRSGTLRLAEVGQAVNLLRHVFQGFLPVPIPCDRDPVVTVLRSFCSLQDHHVIVIRVTQYKMQLIGRFPASQPNGMHLASLRIQRDSPVTGRRGRESRARTDNRSLPSTGTGPKRIKEVRPRRINPIRREVPGSKRTVRTQFNIARLAPQNRQTASRNGLGCQRVMTDNICDLRRLSYEVWVQVDRHAQINECERRERCCDKEATRFPLDADANRNPDDKEGQKGQCYTHADPQSVHVHTS